MNEQRTMAAARERQERAFAEVLGRIGLVYRMNALRGGPGGPAIDGMKQAMARAGRMDLVSGFEQLMDLHLCCPELAVQEEIPVGQMVPLAPFLQVASIQGEEGSRMFHMRFAVDVALPAETLEEQQGALNMMLSMIAAVDMAESIHALTAGLAGQEGTVQ